MKGLSAEEVSWLYSRVRPDQGCHTVKSNRDRSEHKWIDALCHSTGLIALLMRSSALPGGVPASRESRRIRQWARTRMSAPSLENLLCEVSTDFQVVIISVIFVVFSLSHCSYLAKKCVSVENERELCKNTLFA